PLVSLDGQDGGGQSGLAVVDVADSADVDVDLAHDPNSPVAPSNRTGVWPFRPIAIAIFSPRRAKPGRRGPRDADRQREDTADVRRVRLRRWQGVSRAASAVRLRRPEYYTRWRAPRPRRPTFNTSFPWCHMSCLACGRTVLSAAGW